VEKCSARISRKFKRSELACNGEESIVVAMPLMTGIDALARAAR
jgi:hypothetical protein